MLVMAMPQELVSFLGPCDTSHVSTDEMNGRHIVRRFILHKSAKIDNFAIRLNADRFVADRLLACNFAA